MVFVKHEYNYGEGHILNILPSETLGYIEKTFLSIKAKNNSELRTINISTFNNLADSISQIELNQLIKEQFIRTNMMIRDSSFREKSLNLVACIIKLSNTFGKMKDNGILIDIVLTHNELAELSLLTRETVSRNLRKFKEEGLILIQDKKIFVKDIKLLKEKVNCEGCTRDYCSYS